MTITLELSPEVGESVLHQAQMRGVSVSDYLRQIVSQQVGSVSTDGSSDSRKSLKLPALALGDVGTLHRRDIYDDAS